MQASKFRRLRERVPLRCYLAAAQLSSPTPPRPPLPHPSQIPSQTLRPMLSTAAFTNTLPLPFVSAGIPSAIHSCPPHPTTVVFCRIRDSRWETAHRAKAEAACGRNSRNNGRPTQPQQRLRRLSTSAVRSRSPRLFRPQAACMRQVCPRGRRGSELPHARPRARPVEQHHHQLRSCLRHRRGAQRRLRS